MLGMTCIYACNLSCMYHSNSVPARMLCLLLAALSACPGYWRPACLPLHGPARHASSRAHRIWPTQWQPGPTVSWWARCRPHWRSHLWRLHWGGITCSCWADRGPGVPSRVHAPQCSRHAALCDCVHEHRCRQGWHGEGVGVLPCVHSVRAGQGRAEAHVGPGGRDRRWVGQWGLQGLDVLFLFIQSGRARGS